MEEPRRDRPTVNEALAAIQAEDIPADLDIKTVHFSIQATGDVPFRLHPADGGDYVGGVARVTEESRRLT